ncbi:conserved hypothetical protein [Methanococcus vannielii SB]|uniref:Uncharacterized protein n=1 Tax=Methanococcus vannielii (strain ATCC 35089 / DSM 1224 / JCM 13029 / OCM 148 / SB) TaxID=406327 RepID=A6UQE0_METVS|nr:FeGP cofactor biosynthesis guanylyltransferase HcgB family protein [Methanococcus vannielii]ABR54712.1 conserved hypothetical protein [Methanococcus vannielii SB]
MVLEKLISNAYAESLKNMRFGDKSEELSEIQSIILNSKRIVVATNNEKKFKVVFDIISKVCNAEVLMLGISTNSADLTRMPALSKGLIAVDSTDADVVISRGRLGIPGSGSLLLIMDKKGRILTGAMSSSSLIHKNRIEDSINLELTIALERIGILVKK